MFIIFQVFFVPVLCFILYNLFDVVGKQLASWLQWPGPTKTGQAIVLAASFARIVFIPLFMFCNVAPSDRNTAVKNSSKKSCIKVTFQLTRII